MPPFPPPLQFINSAPVQRAEMQADNRILEIERRARRKVDIAVSQQRLKSDSTRVTILNEEDPLYVIQFSNLPKALATALVSIDVDCSTVRIKHAESFLSAVLGSLHTSYFVYNEAQQADFLKHASHIINPRRKLQDLRGVKDWWKSVERFFGFQIVVLDVCSPSSPRLITSQHKKLRLGSTAPDDPGLLVVKDAEGYAGILCCDRETSGTDMVRVITNLFDQLPIAFTDTLLS